MVVEDAKALQAIVSVLFCGQRMQDYNHYNHTSSGEWRLVRERHLSARPAGASMAAVSDRDFPRPIEALATRVTWSVQTRIVAFAKRSY